MPLLPSMVDGLGSQLMQRRQLYAGSMSKLRMLMISRMAKPEEVLIVEDENGNIVRETMKDNDVLVQYKVWISIWLYCLHGEECESPLGVFFCVSIMVPYFEEKKRVTHVLKECKHHLHTNEKEVFFLRCYFKIINGSRAFLLLLFLIDDFNNSLIVGSSVFLVTKFI